MAENISNRPMFRYTKAEVIREYGDQFQFLENNNIKIHTITVNTHLGNVRPDIHAMYQTLHLNKDNIASIIVGAPKDRRGGSHVRALPGVLKEKKTKKLNMKADQTKTSTESLAFFNQGTMQIKPGRVPGRGYINTKIFTNSMLHMTGCKDIADVVEVVTKLIDALKKGGVKETVNRKTGLTEYAKVSYITAKEAKYIGMYDLRISMINSNFKLNVKLNLNKIALLLSKTAEEIPQLPELAALTYDYHFFSEQPSINIKYPYSEKYSPTIIVFATGSVTITGARSITQIIACYKFIKRIVPEFDLISRKKTTRQLRKIADGMKCMTPREREEFAAWKSQPVF